MSDQRTEFLAWAALFTSEDVVNMIVNIAKAGKLKVLGPVKEQLAIIATAKIAALVLLTAAQQSPPLARTAGVTVVALG